MQMWYDRNHRPSQALRGSPVDVDSAPAGEDSEAGVSVGVLGLGSFAGFLGGGANTGVRSLTTGLEADAALDGPVATRSVVEALLAGLTEGKAAGAALGSGALATGSVALAAGNGAIVWGTSFCANWWGVRCSDIPR